MGPGQYDPLTKFGQTKKHFTLGAKRFDLKDKSNAPHAYEYEKAWKSNSKKVHTPKISQRVGREPRPFITPDAGRYNPEKKFGDTHQKMTMRKRPVDKMKNVTPEFYVPDDSIVRSRTPKPNFKNGSKRSGPFSYLNIP